jgi:hypothetical protein
MTRLQDYMGSNREIHALAVAETDVVKERKTIKAERSSSHMGEITAKTIYDTRGNSSRGDVDLFFCFDLYLPLTAD